MAILIILSIITTFIDVYNFEAVNPLTTIKELINVSFYGDPTYFASAALDVAEHGWVSQSTKWVINLWPPGIPIAEAFIIKVFGIDAPIILYLQIVSVLLFSLSMSTMRVAIKEKVKSSLVSFCIPLLVFIPEFARNYWLGPIGVSFGGFFSIALFISGLNLIFISVDSKKSYFLISLGGGVLIGMSAYFRSQYAMYANSILLSGLIVLISYVVLKFIRRSIDRKLASIMLACIVGIFLFMLPWRVYRYLDNADRSIAWVTTSDLVYKSLVTPPNKLADWVRAGGGGIACHLDKTICEDYSNAKENSIRTLKNNFMPWMLGKGRILPAYIFGKYSSGALARAGEVNIYSLLIKLAIVFGFLCALAKSILYLKLPGSKQVRKTSLIFLWLSCSVSIPVLGIMMLVHYEIRYFFAIFSMLTVFATIGMTNLVNQRSNEK